MRRVRVIVLAQTGSVRLNNQTNRWSQKWYGVDESDTAISRWSTRVSFFPWFLAFLHHSLVGYQGVHKGQRGEGTKEIITAFFEPVNISIHLLEAESTRRLGKFTVFYARRDRRQIKPHKEWLMKDILQSNLRLLARFISTGHSTKKKKN